MLVKLWDTKTGKVLFTLDSHEGKEELFFSCSQIFGIAQFPYKFLVFSYLSTVGLRLLIQAGQ